MYKIHLLGENNTVQHTYIFTSDTTTTAAATNTTIIPTPIYPDDTIMTVKLKILMALQQHSESSALSVETMYLFCHKQIPVALGDMYNTLTNNGKNNLPFTLLNVFANNIVPRPDITIPYTTRVNVATFINMMNPDNVDPHTSVVSASAYDNGPPKGPLLQASRAKHPHPQSSHQGLPQAFGARIADNVPLITVQHAIGQRDWVQPTKLIGYNPFLISAPEIENLRILNRISEQTYLPTNNDALIMDTGVILDNTIYLCIANDVLTTMSGIAPEDLIIKTYYPHLWEAGIRNMTDLRDAPNLNTYDRVFSPDAPRAMRLTQYFSTINMFYGVYHEQTALINYLQRGIRTIEICINPEHKYNISLEIIFKILHATQTYPLIKFNPSARQENICRMFSNKISTDGIKIPLLKKTLVLQLLRDIANTPKTVALYSETTLDQHTFAVTCEINDRGQFFVSIADSGTPATTTDPKYLSPSEVDAIIGNTINPIIENIQEYFAQNGYKLAPFITIFAPHIDVLNMSYSILTPFTTLDLGKIKTCVTAVFNNETSIFKTTNKWKLHLRFKRVSHFNKLTSQRAFIIDKIKDGYANSDIAALLVDNFKDDITHADAINLIHTIINEQQLRQKSGRHSMLITDNPGFPVEIEYLHNKLTAHETIVIHINSINNIAYLETIPVYMDTLLRLATVKGNKYTTNYPVHCDARPKRRMSVASSVTYNDTIDTVPSLIHAAPIAAAAATAAVNEEDLAATEDLNDEEARKMQELIAMYGDMDDDDDDDDDDERTADTMTGGTKTVRINVSDDEDTDTDDDDDIKHMQNIDKIKIKRFFQNRIKKRDPFLFTTGMGKNYSRECQANSKRQPIALTADELADVKAQYPNFLRPEDVITYGSDDKHQINYICPRFWCMKTNTPIDPAEMVETVGPDGKKELVHPTCGKIIPDKAKTITPGHYVYEFYGASDAQYPGLIPGKNKSDSCLPCCFAKWNTQGRRDALKKCNTAAAAATNATSAATSAIGLEKTDNVDYIKGADKVPLPLGRWGHLPMQLQFFFKEMNIDCQVSKLVPIVKQDHPCIMRHGVEHTNPAQSFIACMSNVLYYGTGVNIKTIRELKSHILASITLDTFITYQNGNLIDNFYDPKQTELVGDGNAAAAAAAYKNTRIYNALTTQKGDAANVTAASASLHKIISAYENFTKYLENDDVIIDHTYLWDIFSLPNRALFPKGVNLVIFDILNNDITNNITILCPSNYYSAVAYDSAKPTVLIVKQYEYYEPIYSYTKLKEGKIQINKIFMEKDVAAIQPAIHRIIQKIVKPFVNSICRPLNSMPTVYHIKTAPVVDVLVGHLKTCQYIPQKIVLNFENKIIGVITRNNTSATSVYVPCYPSTYTLQTPALPLVLMTDIALWTTYTTTVDFLTTLAATAKAHRVDIPCRPIMQVLEDRLIVGILTETNQFIQISHPTDPADTHPPLPQLKNATMGVMRHQTAIAAAAASGTVDDTRTDYIDRIKKETAFYNVFRNTIKILVNNYTNDAINIKNMILHTCTSPMEIYPSKLKTVRELLHQLGDAHIRFAGDANYYKLIDKFTPCITTDVDKCNTRGICTLSDGTCNIILPIKNLTTSKPNREVYYTRFADELIRYAHIRNYIMEPYNMYSFGNNIGYSLNDDEILLIQSLITAEYFDNLIPAAVNNYIKTMAYDQVNPIIHAEYDNVVNYNQAMAAAKTDHVEAINAITAAKACVIADPQPLAAWGKCVAKYTNADEIRYTCGIQLVNYLIQATTGITLPAGEIKKQLVALYDQIPANKGPQLITTALCEYMQTDIIKPATDTYMILGNSYKLNMIDVWLLTDKYHIPAIIIDDDSNTAVTYSRDDNADFCIIFAEGKNMTEFKLIQKKDAPDNPLINVGSCFESARLGYVSVDTLLEVKLGHMRAPKPKGRPRKVIKVSDSTASMTTSASTPESSMDTDTNAVQIAAPLRKRGRPRKIIQISDSS
jgi:hypothetical protein